MLWGMKRENPKIRGKSSNRRNEKAKTWGCVTVLATVSGQTQLVAQARQLSPQSLYNYYFLKQSLMRMKGKK